MVGEHSSSSIGIDALFQYAGSGVQMFSGMVFYFIVLRMFNTSSVGAIALFIAIIGLFSIIFTFGLNAAAQHFTSFNIGRGDFAAVRKTFTKILGVSFVLALTGFSTLLVLSPVVSAIFLHNAKYTLLIRLLSIDLLGAILFGVLNGVLLGMQNFRLSALINIVIWISYYFGAILLAFFLHSLIPIIIGWIVGIFSGVFIILALLMKLISKYSGPASPPSNKLIFAYSTPILFSAIISYGASYADRFVVAGLMDLSSLGIYNLSLLVVSGIAFVSVPFNNILMPKFSEFFGRGEKNRIAEIVKASGLLLSSMYVPAALGIAALSPMIIDLLGGKGYLGGALPLSIIMLFSAMFIIRSILAQAMASVRRTSIFMQSSAAALFFNVAISIVLIPKFNLVGAAIGFSSVYAATFGVILYYARKEKVASFDTKGILKVWIASTMMFVIVYFMQDIFGHSLLLLPVYIVIGALVYFGLSKILRVFTNENRELVLSLFPVNYCRIRKLISFALINRS